MGQCMPHCHEESHQRLMDHNCNFLAQMTPLVTRTFRDCVAAALANSNQALLFQSPSLHFLSSPTDQPSLASIPKVLRGAAQSKRYTVRGQLGTAGIAFRQQGSLDHVGLSPAHACRRMGLEFTVFVASAILLTDSAGLCQPEICMVRKHSSANHGLACSFGQGVGDTVWQVSNRQPHGEKSLLFSKCSFLRFSDVSKLKDTTIRQTLSQETFGRAGRDAWAHFKKRKAPSR
jgi:hypothetical protein